MSFLHSQIKTQSPFQPRLQPAIMAKLQVRLLVLIALGTTSRCQDAGAPPPESVAVLSSGTPPWGCGPPKPVNVRFNAIKVKGPDSDVAYHRVTVTDFQFELATNTSVSLPSDSFLECAKAAASAGLEAFVFNGSCNGYALNLHFLKCQTGDLVIFVRADYLDEEPVGVPIDEAPYTLIDGDDFDPYRVYMISGFVDADYGLFYSKTEVFEDRYVATTGYDFIFRENGDIAVVSPSFLDYNTCFTKGAYGLKVAVSPATFENILPSLYFLSECGNTIQVSEEEVVVYSHQGFGCQDYPSGLPDECTVIYERADSSPMNVRFSFMFPETGSDDGGLIMTITGSNDTTGETVTKDMFNSNSPEKIYGKTTYEVSLQRPPSKRALGFLMVFS